ncbi:SGNH/GDSL hydrolase family protein [Flavobacterium silvaticum]|uniref:G-D-S-L family lipolytic protein n=1 Tax=Flavobacterium silvaticum TaxID=1852020 RepID=A0A972FLF9_9FLAO|nr:G-D-S-L family lipolytic protein [Flavobacterium silvaticum]NMH28224.1 G-D-S-L family lipolytic protein [Flavobacterium silvaticum]
MIKNYKGLFLASLTIFAACSDDDTVATVPDEPITAGSADFSKYVSVGNSLTAGFSDNALFKAGQLNSYPNILASQFTLVGGGEFKLPLLGDDNNGGLTLAGTPIQGLRYAIQGFNTCPSVTPIIGPIPGVPTNEIGVPLTGQFNNMGVPGAKVFHLLAPGYGNAAGVLTGQANPYFVRFASSPTTSVIADAVAQNPTFFSLWIGNNDVLSYSTSGGTGLNQVGNMNPATYGSNDLTDPTVFGGAYNQLVTALTANGAKGVVANIPYVYTIPFFTTVPANPLTSALIGGCSEQPDGTTAPNIPVGDATIDQLNTLLYGPLKTALTAFGAGDRIELLSKTSANGLLIKDESLPNLSAQLTAAFTPSLGAATAAFYGQVYGQARQAKKTSSVATTDYILLTTQGVIGTNAPSIPAPVNVYGITYPLQDQHVLVPSEVAEIQTATDQFNLAIKAAADAHGLAFMDANALLQQLRSTGIRANGLQLGAAYVSGGAFSLDGVHPGARGYALIANKFLEAINATYGSNFKGVDLNNYPSQYPATPLN